MVIGFLGGGFGGGKSSGGGCRGSNSGSGFRCGDSGVGLDGVKHKQVQQSSFSSYQKFKNLLTRRSYDRVDGLKSELRNNPVKNTTIEESKSRAGGKLFDGINLKRDQQQSSFSSYQNDKKEQKSEQNINKTESEQANPSPSTIPSRKDAARKKLRQRKEERLKLKLY